MVFHLGYLDLDRQLQSFLLQMEDNIRLKPVRVLGASFLDMNRKGVSLAVVVKEAQY